MGEGEVRAHGLGFYTAHQCHQCVGIGRPFDKEQHQISPGRGKESSTSIIFTMAGE